MSFMQRKSYNIKIKTAGTGKRRMAHKAPKFLSYVSTPSPIIYSKNLKFLRPPTPASDPTNPSVVILYSLLTTGLGSDTSPLSDPNVLYLKHTVTTRAVSYPARGMVYTAMYVPSSLSTTAPRYTRLDVERTACTDTSSPPWSRLLPKVSFA